MPTPSDFTIVCATVNEEKLRTNLLASPWCKTSVPVILKRGYGNVCKAFNEALQGVHTPYCVFAHEDVQLPEGFETKLCECITKLEAKDPDWVVAGAAGARWLDGCKDVVANMTDSNYKIRHPALPHLDYIAVQAVDECFVVVKRQKYLPSDDYLANSGDDSMVVKQTAARNFPLWDERFPAHHCIAAELSLRFPDHVYALNLPIHHNTDTHFSGLDAQFMACCGAIYHKYNHLLPIVTPCIELREEGGRFQVLC